MMVNDGLLMVNGLSMDGQWMVDGLSMDGLSMDG